MLELSRKSDYALRAVIYLARLSDDRFGRGQRDRQGEGHPPGVLGADSSSVGESRLHQIATRCSWWLCARAIAGSDLVSQYHRVHRRPATSQQVCRGAPRRLHHPRQLRDATRVESGSNPDGGFSPQRHHGRYAGSSPSAARAGHDKNDLKGIYNSNSQFPMSKSSRTRMLGIL